MSDINARIAARLQASEDPEQFLDALATAAGDSDDLEGALAVIDLVGTPEQYAKRQLAEHTLQTGERGGQFYIDEKGNKVYPGGGGGSSGGGKEQPQPQQQFRVPSQKGSQRLSIGGKMHEPGQPISPEDWAKATKAEKEAFHELTGRLEKEGRKKKFDITKAAKDSERLQGQLEKGEITAEQYKDEMRENVNLAMEELSPKEVRGIVATAKSFVQSHAADLTMRANSIAYDWMVSSSLNDINPQQPMLSTKIWLASQVAAKFLKKLKSRTQVLSRQEGSDQATAQEAEQLHAFLEGLRQAVGIQSEVPSVSELEEELIDRENHDESIDAAGEVERTLFDDPEAAKQYARKPETRNEKNAAMIAGLMGGYGMKDWAFVPSGDGKYQRVRVITLEDKDGNAIRGTDKYEKIIVIDDRAAAKADLYFHCCEGDFWLSEATPVPPKEGPEGLLRIIRAAERRMDDAHDDPMAKPIQVLGGMRVKLDDRTTKRKYAAEDNRPFGPADRTTAIIGQNRELAQQYAAHWRNIEAAGGEVGDDEIEAAGDELEGTGWAVNYRVGASWQVEHLGVGGVTLSRKYCRDGEWSNEPIRYAAEDWIEETGPRSGKPRWKHRTTGRIVYKDPTQGKKQRQEERAARPVNKQGLKEKLAPHAEAAGQLKPEEIKTLDKSFKALQRIHGKGLVARLDEMASQTEKSMGRLKDDPLVKASMGRRMAGINHLLQKAEGAGGETAQPAGQAEAMEQAKAAEQQATEAAQGASPEAQQTIQGLHDEFKKNLGEQLGALEKVKGDPEAAKGIIDKIVGLVNNFVKAVSDAIKEALAKPKDFPTFGKPVFGPQGEQQPQRAPSGPTLIHRAGAGLAAKIDTREPLTDQDVQKLTEAFGGDKLKALAEEAKMRPDGYWGNRKPGGQPYRGPGPNKTADSVFRRDGANGKEILLIQRGPNGVEAGKWALPGGFQKKGWTKESMEDAGVTEEDIKKMPDNDQPWPKGNQPPLGQEWADGESPDNAALREVAEETGLDAAELKAQMKHVGQFEGGGRDPRDNPEAWASTNAYALDLPPDVAQRMVEGRDDAQKAEWVPISELKNRQIAFDHGKIIEAAQKVAATPPDQPGTTGSMPGSPAQETYPAASVQPSAGQPGTTASSTAAPTTAANPAAPGNDAALPADLPPKNIMRDQPHTEADLDPSTISSPDLRRALEQEGDGQAAGKSIVRDQPHTKKDLEPANEAAPAAQPADAKLAQQPKPEEGYRVTGEGPFDSEQDAKDFAESEVGVPFKIAPGKDGKWHLMAKQEDVQESATNQEQQPKLASGPVKPAAAKNNDESSKLTQQIDGLLKQMVATPSRSKEYAQLSRKISKLRAQQERIRSERTAPAGQEGGLSPAEQRLNEAMPGTPEYEQAKADIVAEKAKPQLASGPITPAADNQKLAESTSNFYRDANNGTSAFGGHREFDAKLESHMQSLAKLPKAELDKIWHEQFGKKVKHPTKAGVLKAIRNSIFTRASTIDRVEDGQPDAAPSELAQQPTPPAATPPARPKAKSPASTRGADQRARAGIKKNDNDLVAKALHVATTERDDHMQTIVNSIKGRKLSNSDRELLNDYLGLQHSADDDESVQYASDLFDVPGHEHNRLAGVPLTRPKTVMLGGGGAQLHGSFSQNGHGVKL